MTRPALTPLMLPTSLQPSLTGPRGGAHVTVHRIADDDEPEPAAPTHRPPATIPPAPAVHFTPRPGAQINAAPAPKGKPMRNSPNQDAVLAAIQKKSPITRDALMKATGLDEQRLAQTVWLLKKAPARIAVGGTTRARLYGVPGTEFPGAPAKPAKKAKPAAPQRVDKHNTRTGKATSKPARNSFAAGVAQVEREMGTDLRPTFLAKLESTTGVDSAPNHHARIIRHNHEATGIPCRAIATAAGGAIVLRGNQLTAELSAEELNVIHQLRA